jgi:LuxR family transcriptional regulator, maltose regulon positive regulatory protein
MTVPLLSTKLHIPRPRVNGVPRTRLTAKLISALKRPGQFILISAPAGFGKTTLLAEVAADNEREVAWISLGDEDNDPNRFWNYVIAACRSIQPGIGEAALTLLQTPQPLAEETIPTVLINDLVNLERDLILILDDYHAIQNQPIHLALSFLIDHLPDNLHLILATRVDPPLPLARLRARDRLTEIRVADLRFTREEAASFLTQTMALSLTEHDVDVIESRTEGWVASLQLAGISMREHTDIAGFVKAFAGSNLFVADYLMEEVLKNQTEEVKTFLLQTSILTRLNPSLCDSVRGASDSRIVLRSLYQSNLFVVPLDDEGTWFRYHQLFADLIKAHLHAFASAEDIAMLHRRAAHWYEQADMMSDAISHAISAGDYSYVVKLIEKVALPMLLKAHFKTVADWLATVPSEFLNQSLPVNMAIAWMHLLRGNFEQAAPTLQHLQEMFLARDEKEIDPTLRGEWFALQAILLNAQGNAVASHEIAEKALQLLPDDETQVRSMTYLALSNAYEQLLDYERARQVFETMIQRARTTSDFTSEIFGCSLLGRMLLQQGELHTAYEVVFQAVERMEHAGALSPFSATLFGELAQIYYQWHQIEQARDYFSRSVHWSTLGGFSDAEIYHGVFQSRLLQMEGNLQAAVDEIEQSLHLMQAAAPAFVREEVVAQQVSIFLIVDRIAEAQTALKHYGFAFEDGFVHPKLDNNAAIRHPEGLLFNCAIRVLLYRSRMLGKTETLQAGIHLAANVIDGSLRCRHLPIALQTLLLRAQLQAASGNEEAALADVARALTLAEPEELVSIFVEEESPISELLTILVRRKLLGAVKMKYVESILAAFPNTKFSSEVPPDLTLRGSVSSDGRDDLTPINPLTARELEVLHHLAAGDSNQAIAESLVITLSAVKKHTGNIYAKLNVNSRIQAVVRARQLGLINGYG